MTARSASDERAMPARAVTPSYWSRAWTENGPGYLFLLPWFIGFFGLTIAPILSSLYLSFTNFDMLTAPQWVGMDNYVRMFTHDPKFLQSMRVTLLFVAFSVPLKLSFALGVALLLNRGMKGLPIYRAVFYLPSLLGASVAIAVLWRTLFAGDGLVNKGLAIFGIVGPAWISNPRFSLWTLVALAVWQFGSPMIIFLAGLRQVPRDLYEAAAMDGAGPARRFFRITLPMIAPVVFFNMVLQIIEAFKVFTPAFVLSGGTGGPVDATLVYTLYLYNEAFHYFRMGYASALAWVLLLIIGCFTCASFVTSKYWVHYDD